MIINSCAVINMDSSIDIIEEEKIVTEDEEPISLQLGAVPNEYEIAPNNCNAVDHNAVDQETSIAPIEEESVGAEENHQHPLPLARTIGHANRNQIAINLEYNRMRRDSISSCIRFYHKVNFFSYVSYLFIEMIVAQMVCPKDHLGNYECEKSVLIFAASATLLSVIAHIMLHCSKILLLRRHPKENT
ncbi:MULTISPECIES: hypothetical protein [Candidatus Ichthyocystis]|uniref:Putative membrane protein n=1 Tax=Candidatus Ichthyocystis hellenicum TaxID=1561003 RepID=A0A0S4M5V0_9BURK|nr:MULTISPECIES: hypothetical protein [Ichthyocystis]CUT18306.1 putative membrane protein [Candidatus Ichthyocystis hellenicum]